MVQTNVSLSDVAFIMPKSGQHKSATAVIPPNATCDLRFAAKLKSSSVVLKVRMKLQGGDESLKQPIFNIYIFIPVSLIRTAAEISFINNFEGVRRTLNES